MSTVSEDQRNCILKKLKSQNLSYIRHEVRDLACFERLFSQETRDFKNYLAWDIRDFESAKGCALQSREILKSVLMRGDLAVACALAIPLNGFVYIYSLNILEEYAGQGLLEDMLFIFLWDIISKTGCIIEGQPFLFNCPLDVSRLEPFEHVLLEKVFMVCDTSKAVIHSQQDKAIMALNINLPLEFLAGFITESYAQHPESNVSSFYRSRGDACFYLNDLLNNQGCGPYLPGASCIAFGDGKVLGFDIITSTGEGRGHLAQIAVKKGFRKKGIGGFLLRNSINWLKENGYTTVSLSVAKKLFTHEWYSSIGFRDVLDFTGFRILGPKGSQQSEKT